MLPQHVARSLNRLEELGLCGKAPGTGQAMIRWVVWPPPAITTAGSTKVGSTTVGNTPQDAVPESGNIAITTTGNHQEEEKKKKQEKKKPTAKSPRKPAHRKPKSTDPRVTEFIDWFFVRFREVHGRKYIVSGGEEGATVKRLLRAFDNDEAVQDSLAALKDATENMLADSFWSSRASVRVLGSHINKWRQSDSAGGDDAEDLIARRNMDELERRMA